MQRTARTYVIGAALAMVLTGLTACSGSSDGDTGDDTKSGDQTATADPAPGKYQTLPEPCGTVGTGTLKELLPGPSDSGGSGDDSGPSSGATDSPYKGRPSVTYDTDRRVGCHWKNTSSLSTRHLSIDLERVVSYDPDVSDDEQAEQLYADRGDQADIPGMSKPTGDKDDAGASDSEKSDNTPTEKQQQGQQEEQGRQNGGKGDGEGKATGRPTGGGGSRAADDETGNDLGKSSESAGHGANSGAKTSSSGGPGPNSEGTADSGSDSSSDEESDSPPPSPSDDLSPRTLDDIGDNAYINDKLDTGDSGVHRDITLVFRSANVVATVKYDQWLTDKDHTPDSAELQNKARKVAEELATDLDEG